MCARVFPQPIIFLGKILTGERPSVYKHKWENEAISKLTGVRNVMIHQWDMAQMGLHCLGPVASQPKKHWTGAWNILRIWVNIAGNKWEVLLRLSSFSIGGACLESRSRDGGNDWRPIWSGRNPPCREKASSRIWHSGMDLASKFKCWIWACQNILVCRQRSNRLVRMNLTGIKK
jgi:hypothetical protein